MTADTIATRIRRRLKKLDLSVAEAGVRTTGSRSFVKNILDNASTSPRGENLMKLARVLETSPEWLVDESGPENVSYLEGVKGSWGAPAFHEDQPPPLAFEVTSGAIPEFDLRAGASYGGGYISEFIEVPNGSFGGTRSAEPIKDQWVLPSSFLQGELRLKPASTHVVAIDGPSMLPDLAPGDRVLIDLSHRDPRQGGIFAVREGDSVIVKHVEFVRGSDPPRIKCVSSNPTYSPFELELDGEQNAIIGRIACRIARM